MNTATYSSSTANDHSLEREESKLACSPEPQNGAVKWNLWNLIQGLSLTTTDQRWLADRLFESAKADDTAILAQARKAIEGMRQQSEENGNSEMTLDEINAEIRATRLDCQQGGHPCGNAADYQPAE